MKFKLSTKVRTWGRVRGWNATTDLEDTIKHLRPEDKPALIAAITAELSKAVVHFEECERLIKFAKRGTRSGKNIGAKYDRAYYKKKALQDALNQLEAR